MKLILTQEVAGLGMAGDVVIVKDGYGRNYLVPRGLAITWTISALSCPVRMCSRKLRSVVPPPLMRTASRSGRSETGGKGS